MLEPLDYEEREQAFAFVGRSLGDFVPDDHPLRRLEQAMDLRRLCAPLKDAYPSDLGRPAVHPEVLVRALLVNRIYGISSFRQLCRDLSYNLAYRYFCLIPIHKPVFDHSTLSRFFDRLGRPAFEGLCADLDVWLRQAGLVSEEGYLDSTLIEASASSDGLRPTLATAQAFAAAVTEANGLFQGPSGPEPESALQVYQDRAGKLPLPGSDPDARWARGSRGPARLAYKVSALTSDEGFITGHRLDLGNVGDAAAGQSLLASLRHGPSVLTADTAYSAGEFRRHLRSRGIRAHIPLPRDHPPAFLSEQGFSFNSFALVCVEGQSLKATAKPEKRVHYRAQKRLCAGCLRQAGCAAARKYGFTLGADTRELMLALPENRTASYRRAVRRRQPVAEGTMASLKRLGLQALKHRGLERVGIIVNLTVIAHNLLKLLRLSKHPDPASTPGAGQTPAPPPTIPRHRVPVVRS